VTRPKIPGDWNFLLESLSSIPTVPLAIRNGYWSRRPFRNSNCRPYRPPQSAACLGINGIELTMQSAAFQKKIYYTLV
jgi:hypothetical protein